MFSKEIFEESYASIIKPIEGKINKAVMKRKILRVISIVLIILYAVFLIYLMDKRVINSLVDINNGTVLSKPLITEDPYLNFFISILGGILFVSVMVLIILIPRSIYIIINSNKSIIQFNNEVLNPFIKMIFPNVTYNSEGIKKESFIESNLIENITMYNSWEQLEIRENLYTINIADVLLRKSSGSEDRLRTVFEGKFAKIECKNKFPFDIIIEPIYRENRKNENYVQLEATNEGKINKYYTWVKEDEKNKELLIKNFANKFIEYSEKNKKDIYLRIINNNIYFAIENSERYGFFS
jgi:hypothetical protein